MGKQQTEVEKYRTITKAGFELLAGEKGYTQKAVIRKLLYLGFEISNSGFNNILKGKSISLGLAMAAAEQIKSVVKDELCIPFLEDKNSFAPAPNPNWKSKLVQEQNHPLSSSTLKFHAKGRLSTAEKTSFIQSANYEICEFGLRLKQFTEYFYSRSDGEFKKYIVELLEKGVNVKLYLLHPDSQEAKIYFNDRAKLEAFKDEQHGAETIKSVIEKIKRIKQEFEEKGYRGKFELYQYKHIPYNHFLIVDGSKPKGKLLVSHYLYGVHRGKCPVVEVSRTGDLELYQNYWKSFKALTKDAKKIL